MELFVEKVIQKKKNGDIEENIVKYKMTVEYLEHGLKIYPIDEKTQSRMGEVWIEMYKHGDPSDPRYSNLTRIFNIETYPEFQNRRVGGAMLDAVEYLSFKNGIYHVNGLYAPSNGFAKRLYLHHGYEIDEYDEISKALNQLPHNVTEGKENQQERIK